MKLLNFLFALLFVPLTLNAAPTPLSELEKQLKEDGLKGWVHGATEPLNLYVFTYREPGDFFSHREFPLIPGNEAVSRALQGVKRHDQVILKGNFLANQAPITHIWVSQLNVINTYESPTPVPEPYPYKADLPEDLFSHKEIFAKVHAVVNNGKVLVIEYKDAIVPVVVGNPSLAKDLYRNDKIRLKIEVRDFPSKPTHVSLDLQAKDPLILIDRMVDWHGKKGAVDGPLVLFPKSPQVSFNVFAIQVADEQGILREFTLVNFEDTKVFEQIREKLQKHWDSETEGIENGRNKLINRNVRIKATGVFNVVDPGQANPQVLLSGPESIQLLTN
jgi:hypothetical protein